MKKETIGISKEVVMPIIIYKNGIRMRTIDKAIQKAIQVMRKAVIGMIELHYEEGKKAKRVIAFVTKE